MKNQSPPAFSMGKQERGTNSRKDRDLAGVSPFSYTTSFIDKRKDPVFSMGAKLGSALKNSVCSPDPTAYSPNITLSKYKAP